MHGFNHGAAWAVAAVCLGGLLLLQVPRRDAPHPAIAIMPAAAPSTERLDRHEFDERAGETSETADDDPLAECLM